MLWKLQNKIVGLCGRLLSWLLHGEAVEPFRLWAAKVDKTEY